MALGTALLLLAFVLLIGSLPAWPYSRGWGYMPSGVVGVLVLVLLALLVLGRL